MAKIKCPDCGRILGDTTSDMVANINCKNCKKSQPIAIKIHKFDYLTYKEEK